MGAKMTETDTQNPQRPFAKQADSDHPPSRQRLPLRTIRDCSREMAKIYREARAGKLDVSDASRLSNMLAVLARMLETSDLEKRVESLENQQSGRYS